MTKLVEGLRCNFSVLLPGGMRGGRLSGTSPINQLGIQHAEGLQKQASFRIAVSPVR